MASPKEKPDVGNNFRLAVESFGFRLPKRSNAVFGTLSESSWLRRKTLLYFTQVTIDFSFLLSPLCKLTHTNILTFALAHAQTQTQTH